MALKPTVRRKQILVPVDWHDSEWDLEVTVRQPLAPLNRLNELNEEGRCEATGRTFHCGHLTLWRRNCKRVEVKELRKSKLNRGNGWTAGISALRGGIMKNG